MSDAIDWASPIKLPRGSIPFGVRQEQIRRAEILVTAAGGKLPKGAKGWALRVEALAAVVPGMRYSTGIFLYQTLAPDAEVIMSAARDPSKPKPGRPTTWPDDRLAALVAVVDQMRAASVRPMTDAQALAKVRKLSLDHGRAKADLDGRVFDDAARTKATMPKVDTLANYLALGRRLKAGE